MVERARSSQVATVRGLVVGQAYIIHREIPAGTGTFSWPTPVTVIDRERLHRAGPSCWQITVRYDNSGARDKKTLAELGLAPRSDGSRANVWLERRSTETTPTAEKTSGNTTSS